VLKVPEKSASKISWVPRAAAVSPRSPSSSMWRSMFSTTTMASSTSMPTAMMIAVRVTMLNS
jgi:hypothetical protein